MVKEIIEKADSLRMSDAFKEIKPQGNISYESAADYVRNRFEAFNDSSYREKMMNYDIKDLDTKFSFDDEIDGLILEFGENNWMMLDIDERCNLIEKMADAIGKRLKLEDNVEVKFFIGNKDNCGWFNGKEKAVVVNLNIFDSPEEVLDTLAHEMKHAHQYSRAQKCETEQDRLYKYNFKHYISPMTDKNGFYVNFLEYQGQFIEAEARAFAQQFVERV